MVLLNDIIVVIKFFFYFLRKEWINVNESINYVFVMNDLLVDYFKGLS